MNALHYLWTKPPLLMQRRSSATTESTTSRERAKTRRCCPRRRTRAGAPESPHQRRPEPDPPKDTATWQGRRRKLHEKPCVALHEATQQRAHKDEIGGSAQERAKTRQCRGKEAPATRKSVHQHLPEPERARFRQTAEPPSRGAPIAWQRCPSTRTRRACTHPPVPPDVHPPARVEAPPAHEPHIPTHPPAQEPHHGAAMAPRTSPRAFPQRGHHGPAHVHPRTSSTRRPAAYTSNRTRPPADVPRARAPRDVQPPARLPACVDPRTSTRTHPHPTSTRTSPADVPTTAPPRPHARRPTRVDAPRTHRRTVP
ncbi:hypothetical protein B0H10DRAFT_2127503, partial [Mycena sp. CBHHK59/15]